MSNQHATAWIRLPDFAEVSLWISVVNSTTQVPVPPDSTVDISEVSSNGLTLRLPIRSCALGHFLKVTIRKQKKLPWEYKPPMDFGPVDEMEFTVKVTDEQPLDDTTKAVTLTMYQFDEWHWKNILKDMMDRQTEIDKVVTRIRE